MDIIDRLAKLDSASNADGWWTNDESFSELSDVLREAQSVVEREREELTNASLAREAAEGALREVLDYLEDCKRGIAPFTFPGPRLSAVVTGRHAYSGPIYDHGAVNQRDIDAWNPYEHDLGS